MFIVFTQEATEFLKNSRICKAAQSTYCLLFLVFRWNTMNFEVPHTMWMFSANRILQGHLLFLLLHSVKWLALLLLVGLMNMSYGKYFVSAWSVPFWLHSDCEFSRTEDFSLSKTHHLKQLRSGRKRETEEGIFTFFGDFECHSTHSFRISFQQST